MSTRRLLLRLVAVSLALPPELGHAPVARAAGLSPSVIVAPAFDGP